MRSFHRWLVWSVLSLAFIFSSPAQAATVPPRDRVLILVSLDGFRWDYLQKFNPPNLTRLAAEGVRAERLIPAFPSVTFPNHYTIVTGLWPEHHGIVGNNFYDPAFKTNYNAFNSGSLASRWWGGRTDLGHGHQAGPRGGLHVLAGFGRRNPRHPPDGMETVR